MHSDNVVNVFNISFDFSDIDFRGGLVLVGVVVVDIDLFETEGFSTVSGEHSSDDVKDDQGLSVVSLKFFVKKFGFGEDYYGSTLDEDVLGGELDLGVVTVDDGRKGKNTASGIENDWVVFRVSDDG